tara:strand:+ start:203 stop:922 length:720 start_codon:yes stop_codon:yes gene_type:complete
MGMHAGPRIRKKDLCLVADARNPLIKTSSTTQITNIIERANHLTGTGLVTVEDTVAGTSFSFEDGNDMTQSSWSPVINKYNFSIVYWIKFQSGKDNNYTRIWETNTTDNPSHAYYYICDTRTTASPSILHFVKDYSNSDWATSSVITNGDWENSTTWFQLAITVAEEGEFKNYKNGVLHSTTTTSTEDLSSYGNIDQIEFGSTYNTTGARCGHFSVYREVLSAADILENYNTLKPRFGL